MIGRSGATVPVAGKPEACTTLLPEANWPEKTIPILYLPDVSRQELRAVAECPPALMPLAELQYRGAFWSQVNHKDWTVLAFLQSADGGLGLDVARDTATLEAMKTALVKLVATDIQDLTGHRLEASDFHALLSPDPVREILAWMNDPKAAQAKLTAQQWEAFCHSCKDKFGFHPMKDGPLRAAEMMGLRQGNWGQVWDRFREAPKRYPNLPGWLRKAKPQDDDLFLKESDEVWPQSNEIHETALRNVLKGCAGKTAQVVIERIKEMEAVHGKRRSWVWAELDLAPLAVALKHLTTMAETCGKPVAGGALDDLVAAYINGGWCADAAVVDALGVVEKKDDIEAVPGGHPDGLVALAGSQRPGVPEVGQGGRCGDSAAGTGQRIGRGQGHGDPVRQGRNRVACRGRGSGRIGGDVANRVKCARHWPAYFTPRRCTQRSDFAG
jgi:hypothetical protein